MHVEKIAFVNCPMCDVNYPPVGIAHLSTYLNSKGYTTKIFDFNIRLYHESVNRKWWRRSRIYQATNLDNIKNFESFSNDTFISLAKEILDYKSDVMCFSLNMTSVLFSMEVAKKIKELNKKCVIVFGGPGACPELFLAKGINPKEYVDILIIGEGEKALHKTLKDIHKLKKKKSLIILNGELIKSLDKLPIPDYKGFDLKAYKSCKKGIIPLVDSRGCPHNCTFCFEKNYWKIYRARNPKNIVKEFELRKKEGFKEVFFSDSLINGNPQNLDILCEELIKKRLNMRWQANATINESITYRLLKHMKKAGCYCLTYGADSASTKVLKAMNKNLTPFGISKTVIKTRLAGIRVHTNWIIGFPNEDLTDFLKTLLFIIFHRPFISVLTLIPTRITLNSKMHKDHEKFNICSDTNFSSMQDWKTVDNKNNRSVRRKRWLVVALIASFLGYRFPN